MTPETVILSNLLRSKEYTEKAIPYLKEEYFPNDQTKLVFRIVNKFYSKYLTCPSKAVVLTELDGLEGVPEQIHNLAKTTVKELPNEEQEEKWLLDTTEKFCQDRALYNAVLRSITILDGKDKQLTKDALPGLLTDALGVSFNNSIGHDYVEDAEDRYEYYHTTMHRVDFDIEMFNNATKGGFAKKTVNVLIAGPNVGKTLCMCHLASYWLRAGKNVLYITLEMSREEIGKRIDSNLLDCPLGLIDTLSKESFDAKISRLKQRSVLGKLIIQEYPTGSAGANEFRNLLNNLRMKKGFIPDIVIVDYLNICKSSSFTNKADSYGYAKSIIEEQRGLSVEFNYCCVTATQFNRTGAFDTDADMDGTSESFGVPMTADLMWAIIAPDEFIERGLYIFKQLKSRYDNKNRLRRFVVGVDMDKQRLYNAEASAQSMLYENRNKSKASEPENRVEKAKTALWSEI